MTTLESRPAVAARPVPADRPPEVRRSVGTLTLPAVASVAGAGLGAVALVWIVYERLFALSGTVGFWICCYAAFLVLYVAILAQTETRLTLVDKLMRTIAASAGALVIGALVLVIVYTIARGITAVRGNFLTRTMAGVDPFAPLDQGGALHAIVGTLMQVSLALAITIPLGIATALFLNEIRGPLARPVRTIVETMAAIPSIVAGLFVFAAVILTLGLPRSGLAAALAISVMMLPIITRTAEVVFRLVPNGLREASYALGASQWRTVWNVVLPTARPGLVTAVILGTARGVGETAPVLLTAGFTEEMNADPLRDPQVSLPLYIFNYVRQPSDVAISRAYGAALVLLVLVLVLFVLARTIGGRPPGELSRRQRRRLAEDAARPGPAPAPAGPSFSDPDPRPPR